MSARQNYRKFELCYIIYVVFAGWTLLLIVSLVCGGKFLRNVYMREEHLQTATFEIIENLSVDKEWYFYRFRIDKYFLIEFF